MSRSAAGLIFATGIVLCLASCGGSGGSTPPPTYTIGGTVAGLSGTGLMLQDNGGNNLAVSANGAFAFTVPVPSGGAYNVTVLAQPSNPTQTCVVSSGSGAATGNVNSVQVACTSMYTIGGTVSGLAGTGLVLQNNGGDNLPVNASGSFTFATAIASGASYNVTVSSQPSNPAQNCVVSNGAGSASANVNSVQVTCTTIPLYTIGGTLSGLSSNTNILLLDNGTDQLPVSVNGSFTFNTSILAGSSYNVTVSRQPFNEKCTVTNGSGTANANVTNVQVTCASKLKVLYSFGVAPDGSDPESKLVFDSAGNLYGVTLSGGTAGAGIVYKLAPTASGPWTETVLHNFCQQANCADGGASRATMVFDASGNLYGTTSSGGAYNGGVVFEMTPQSNGTWTYTVLHSFGNGTDGLSPSGGVALDSAGNLYGTTGAGGTTTTFCAGGCGVAYELSPGSSSWTETILYNFCSQTGCVDGNGPGGVLVFDASGNLYGTTLSGGVGGSPDAQGTVFELAPSGNGQWTQSVLLTFLNNGVSHDGYQPTGGVTLTHANSSVVLLGTTEYGGLYGNNGLLYSLTPPGGGGLPWFERPVWNFCGQTSCADGSFPNAGLALDSSGYVYGTNMNEGATSVGGTVYQVSLAGSEVTIYSFEGGNDGYQPKAGVILDAAGNLYGVSEGGEPQSPTGGQGVVFEVTP